MTEAERENPQIKHCDECGSGYVAASSKMTGLCPECAHHLYGYPNCVHVFENGHCAVCRWDGSRSEYLRKLVDGGGSQGQSG